MKNKIRTIIINILSNTLGNLLVFLQPHKARELSKKGMTLVMKNDLSVKERLMRRAILKKTEKKGNFKELAEFHENYWANKGADFFDANNKRLEHINLPFCDFIFDLLGEELSKQNEGYHTLVEIGTGNGRVLDYLSTKFHGLDKFIGIDLSEVQTNNNTRYYKKNPKLEFVTSDAFDWVDKHGQGNTIFLTFMGVLEYFTEQKLQDFLIRLNSLGKIIFVAIEPNGINHDFVKNPHSQVYGTERSFSHNYPKLFKNSGFEFWHSSKKTLEGNICFMNFIGAKN
ncbi:class I SAM-dependent methyltransferase [Maribacter sp. 2304DJ31-5]|uniref:class I SAM-dependent methyltransferase n=1 Tax=Maribacter sp. 2304DJ31-5 TaxID=3386273 RepID=UPI0039BCD1D5